ncbi:GAP family protein [Brachybacterium sp. ACRRE]|uniref:GAP family protein n=1 Tax=Brachybacterium sp. ACRRE TaxID=2918184 RepID=UPI001EF1A378|nr:GAP family protein [Brachybacterium sp. ACRRE]MCG7310858.1 GAP family protein [Brachybacterium sp. ACRRE]
MDALTHAAGPLGLVVLALVDSTSVGTLVIPAMLLVLGQGGARRVAGRTVLYLLVIGVFYLVLGLVLLAGLLPLMQSAQGLLETPAAAVALAAIGAGLLAWSFRLDPKSIRKRGGDPEASARRWSERVRSAAGRPRALVGLALLAGVIEAASMLPYLAAMGIIGQMGLGFARGALVLVGYCAVMILPGLVLAGVRALAGARADRLLQRLHDWAIRSAAETLSWVVGIVGVILLLRNLGTVLDVLGIG